MSPPQLQISHNSLGLISLQTAWSHLLITAPGCFLILKLNFASVQGSEWQDCCNQGLAKQVAPTLALQATGGGSAPVFPITYVWAEIKQTHFTQTCKMATFLSQWIGGADPGETSSCWWSSVWCWNGSSWGRVLPAPTYPSDFHLGKGLYCVHSRLLGFSAL